MDTAVTAELCRLFRSSRPDYIETIACTNCMAPRVPNCSGLPDRTTLRLRQAVMAPVMHVQLFRSSRPDYIETKGPKALQHPAGPIVPVFQTGLH